jgi:hypothetical protein
MVKDVLLVRKSGSETEDPCSLRVKSLLLKPGSLFLFVMSSPKVLFYFSQPFGWALLALSIWFSLLLLFLLSCCYLLALPGSADRKV